MTCQYEVFLGNCYRITLNQIKNTRKLTLLERLIMLGIFHYKFNQSSTQKSNGNAFKTCHCLAYVILIQINKLTFYRMPPEHPPYYHCFHNKMESIHRLLSPRHCTFELTQPLVYNVLNYVKQKTC